MPSPEPIAQEHHLRSHPEATPQASYGRAGPGPNNLPSGVTVATACRNIIVCTSASGGLGLSVTAASIARRLTERDLPSALIDVDFRAGGLDVLLGIEGEPGTRCETLDAPLGRLDGNALSHELPEWDGVRVLASNPWSGEPPDWWQTQAAVRALSDVNRALIVDAGRGELLETMPELGGAAQIVLAELSVLGLARAKRHIATLQRWMALHEPLPAKRSTNRSYSRDQLIVIGIQPRSTVRNTGVISLPDAAEYLGHPVSGRIRTDSKLCADVLSGLGIRALSRSNRRAIDGICDWIDELLSGAGGDHS